MSRTMVKKTENMAWAVLFYPKAKCGLRSTGFARLSWRMRSSSIVSYSLIHSSLPSEMVSSGGDLGVDGISMKTAVSAAQPPIRVAPHLPRSYVDGTHAWHLGLVLLCFAICIPTTEPSGGCAKR